jgi:hypothetical protein
MSIGGILKQDWRGAFLLGVRKRGRRGNNFD